MRCFISIISLDLDECFWKCGGYAIVLNICFGHAWAYIFDYMCVHADKWVNQFLTDPLLHAFITLVHPNSTYKHVHVELSATLWLCSNSNANKTLPVILKRKQKTRVSVWNALVLHPKNCGLENKRKNTSAASPAYRK